MREVVIVSGARTAIGNYQGSLESFSAVDLGVVALKGALEKAGIGAELIQEVIAGQCNQAGSPGNTSRYVALKSGCPIESAAFTVHQQCASSMRAAELLSQEIMLGKIDVGAAVGVESMTNAPYLLFGARKGYRLGNAEQVTDSLMKGGLICDFVGYHMGITADNIAEQYGISREEQDEFALMSHQRACRAIKEGWFKDEIVPVEVKTRKGTVVFDTDEHPLPDTSLEALAKLRPAFKKDGTVTAGNASGLKQEDIDYFEFNEAFAAQVLGVNRELKVPLDRLNALGSGIALGHPVGATGARLILTMSNEMKRRGVRYGCAALCASGGPAHAFIIESI